MAADAISTKLALEAAARSEIDSFVVMDVMRAAADLEARGRSIVHMEVGQPATPAPLAAREAAKRAIDGQTLGYTQALGTDALREAISQHYRATYGVDVEARRVIVTTGSSAGFVLAFLALFDAGDTVLLPSPGYPCYRHILSALGCRPKLIETGPHNRWMPTAADIAALAEGNASEGRGPVRGLLVASPSNPTGTMIEPERLAALVTACAERGMWFVSDEIYHGLTFGRPVATALQYSDDAVIINSFSKYFSMTGWRIGWMIVPDRLVRTVERLAQNLFISAPAISQAAALGAFEARDELDANVRAYAANRDLLLRELPLAGFTSIVPADGAFYLYADVSDQLTRHPGATSRDLARRILEEAGVAVTPGVDFDTTRGGRFLRFSYAGSTSDMTEAARRLRAWGG